MLPGSRNTLLGNNVIIVFGTDVVSSRRSTLPRHSQYLKCTDWCLVSVCREWVETDKNGLLSITIRPHPPPINSLIIHSEISILEDRKFRNFQRLPPTRIFERTNVCTIDFVINNRSNGIPYIWCLDTVRTGSGRSLVRSPFRKGDVVSIRRRRYESA